MTQLDKPIDPDLVAFVDEFHAAAQGVKDRYGFTFPLGACGWGSQILGHLLHEQGFGDWQLVRNEGQLAETKPGIQHHSWLEQDGIFIDVSVEQFKDSAEFMGRSLPLVHRGDSPMNSIFTRESGGESSRSVLEFAVEREAARQDHIIRANLGLK